MGPQSTEACAVDITAVPRRKAIDTRVFEHDWPMENSCTVYHLDELLLLMNLSTQAKFAPVMYSRGADGSRTVEIALKRVFHHDSQGASEYRRTITGRIINDCAGIVHHAQKCLCRLSLQS